MSDFDPEADDEPPWYETPDEESSESDDNAGVPEDLDGEVDENLDDTDFRVPEFGSAHRRFVDHFTGRALRILDDLDDHLADRPPELTELAEDLRVSGAFARDRLAGSPGATAVAPVLAVYESLRAEALALTGASAAAGEWLRTLVRKITELLRRLACLLAGTARTGGWTRRGDIEITYGEPAPRRR